MTAAAKTRRKAPAAAPARDSEAVAGFMAGKCLVADMFDACSAVDPSGDAGELDCRYRPGRQQCVPIADHLQTLIARSSEPGFLAGFAAALSHKMGHGWNVGEMPDAIRNMSYDQCTGGPTAEYASEDEGPATPQPRDLDMLLDKVDEQLSSASGRIKWADDYLIDAQTSSTLARSAASLSDAANHLQDARKAIYKAHTSAVCSNSEASTPAGQAREDLLSAHRLLNGLLGGTMDCDRPKGGPYTALDILISRLDTYLDATHHIDSGAETGKDVVESLLNAGAWGAFWDAFEAERRGHEEGAMALLPSVREGIAAAFGQCDQFDGRWPLLKASLEVLDEFLASGTEFTEQDDGRLEVARQSACFIMRLADYFNNGAGACGNGPTASDLLAFHDAGRVVLNAVDDPAVTVEELTADLQAALDRATVLFLDQPPAWFPYQAPAGSDDTAVPRALFRSPAEMAQ